MLDRLPPELIRRIILANVPSVIVRSSIVSRDLYAMDLHKLLLPIFMEGLTDVDAQEGITFRRRTVVNNSFRAHSRHLATQYGVSGFAVNAAFLADRLAGLVGDRAEFDCPHNVFRKHMCSWRRWKVLGYLNADHFERSEPSRTERNMVCGFLQVDLDPWHTF